MYEFDLTCDECRVSAIILAMEQGVINSVDYNAFSPEMKEMINHRANDILENEIFFRQDKFDYSGAFANAVLYMVMAWLSGKGIETARIELNGDDDVSIIDNYEFGLELVTQFIMPVVTGLATYKDCVADMRRKSNISGVVSMQRIFFTLAKKVHMEQEKYNGNEELMAEIDKIIFDLETMHLDMYNNYEDVDSKDEMLSQYIGSPVSRMIMLEAIVVGDICESGHLHSDKELEPILKAKIVRENRIDD